MSVSVIPATTASHAPTASFRKLMLGAIGVVFGDIGTSPLYTIRRPSLRTTD